MKEYKETSSSQEFQNFNLKFHGLSTFRNQVVYVDLHKDENYKYLENIQSISMIKIKIFHLKYIKFYR